MVRNTLEEPIQQMALVSRLIQEKALFLSGIMNSSSKATLNKLGHN